KEEEKTKEVLQDNWFFTGDMAREDEDGYYWMIDRKKDMILSGGVNVYPKEIENVLSAHPDIIEVAVVGVPHPDWGETVKAVVVPEKGVNDVETLCRDFLEGKIAHFKVLRLYEVIDSLPRNATGKVDKNQLRKQQVLYKAGSCLPYKAGSCCMFKGSLKEKRNVKTFYDMMKK